MPKYHSMFKTGLLLLLILLLKKIYDIDIQTWKLFEIQFTVTISLSVFLSVYVHLIYQSKSHEIMRLVF